MQPGEGWPHAVAGGESRGRAGLQVQQRGFPGQVAQVRVGEDGGTGPGKVGTFRQSKILHCGKIIDVNAVAAGVGENCVPCPGPGHVFIFYSS